MKKLLGLALISGLFFSVNAEAALYRVDFSGTVDDGTYNGYFTYDNAGLDLNGFNSSPGGLYSTALPEDGLETSLAMNISSSSVSGSFDETTAGSAWLNFTAGELTGWLIGGNNSGFTSVSSSTALDFSLVDNAFVTNTGLGYGGLIFGSGPDWQVTELSAVPLPGAVWAFGAGLLGLLGLKRRRKMKMLRTATA
ncbi:hypothetical protein J0X12_14200 [Sneathiella sp. CAU 1612]|uniref:PEP-CTERM protein-sorting domain-containing protein n=1 Tax=Sneathiella sedimenti TaxID=2816034 RepID=A0ABS3F8D2_9PROT|nr:hypothetical protein [Sneathiella sedimenti]MBO0334774.1 hypothetical protein [Sneathiella sedimenti]